MATPAFFNYEQYMTAKLAQVQNADPKAGWTMTKLMDTFTQNGFVGPDGAYAHFVQFGAAEEVAPNASFNANEYYAAKAAQFYGVEAKAVTEFQVASVKQIINSNGMNAWTHYQQFGSNEGVNPSNDFDAAAYLAAKATAMGGEWTAAKVADAIKGNGMTVLEHYLTYAGTGDTEVAKGATYPVADDKKVPSHNPGTTYNLTADIDNFTGTAGDDNFFGSEKTTQAADQIDGGAGDDTFTFTGVSTDPAKPILPTMTSIENLVFKQNDSSAIDVSKIDGLKTVTLDKHADTVATTTMTLAGQEVTLKSMTKAVTFKGDDTALNLTVDGVKDATTAPTITVASKMATVNLTALNNDSAFTLTDTGTALKTLNIKGDAKADVATAATLTTIDASANSAGVKIDMSKASADGTLTFTGTAAADEIIFKAAHLTKADVLDGGAGRDILTVNDTAMDYAGINAAKNFEVLNLGTKGATVDVAKITNGINEFGMGNVAAATFSNALSTSKFFVNVGEGATDAAQALTIANKAGDTSATTVTFTNNGVVATLADVVNATAISTLNLASEGKFANSVTVDLLNTGTVKLTGSADMKLAHVSTVTTDEITIDATAFTGKLTYTGGAGVDIVNVGAKGSTITGGKGADQITLGAGADTVVFAAGDSGVLSKDKIADYDVVSSFTAGAKGDVLQFGSSTTAKYDALTADELATVAKSTDLTAAANAALASATNSNWTAFTYGDKTYAIYDTDDTFDAAAGVIVELSGVKVADLTADNFHA